MVSGPRVVMKSTRSRKRSWDGSTALVGDIAPFTPTWNSQLTCCCFSPATDWDSKKKLQYLASMASRSAEVAPAGFPPSPAGSSISASKASTTDGWRHSSSTRQPASSRAAAACLQTALPVLPPSRKPAASAAGHDVGTASSG